MSASPNFSLSDSGKKGPSRSEMSDRYLYTVASSAFIASALPLIILSRSCMFASASCASISSFDVRPPVLLCTVRAIRFTFLDFFFSGSAGASAGGTAASPSAGGAASGAGGGGSALTSSTTSCSSMATALSRVSTPWMSRRSLILILAGSIVPSALAARLGMSVTVKSASFIGKPIGSVAVESYEAEREKASLR